METIVERELRLLGQRVERLEGLVVRTVAWASALCLVLGQLLPFIPVNEDSDEEDVMASLLTAGFRALAFRDSEGETDGFSIAAGIGFLGLLLVTVVALYLLSLIASGSATQGTQRVIGVTATLLVVGTVVAGIFALLSLSAEDVGPGWGVVVFAVGVALFLVVAFSGLRDWWEPARRARGTVVLR
ncbi:hypothetical protein ACOACO_17685 [Nocardioides sp. CPCC 205120]|uniref:hypothetical protein n=1 Tax=Nocardioides sp. CPCC 205120 TaxID=3406462 RepID=UPI003B502A84